MTPTDLTVHLDQPPTNLALAIAPYVVGVLAFVATLAVVWQKHRSDNRDHWWKRTTWALDRLLDADDADSQILAIELLDAVTGPTARIPRRDSLIAQRLLDRLFPEEDPAVQEAIIRHNEANQDREGGDSDQPQA